MTHSGPEVLFKTCVTMKFMDDDDDELSTECNEVGSMFHIGGSAAVNDLSPR